MRDLATRRRAAILAAAERLFRHYGPGKTTVADIAQQARVGVGTVYLEFPSKDAIFGALSERRYAALLEGIGRAWSAPAPSHGARLRRALDARFEGFLAAGAQGQHARDLLHCPCPPIERAHARYVEAETRLFADLLTRGVEAGELVGHGHDAVRTARALLRCYACFAPPLLDPEAADALREAIEDVHRVVFGGLERGRGR